MPITTEPSATADGEHTFAFGPFRLLAAQRLLLEGDTPVRLGSRASISWLLLSSALVR